MLQVFFSQSSCYHTRHLTFFFHQVFKGLPFYIVWDVADKHAVSFVHISIGFVAPASTSLLGSLFPACIGLMLGFSIHFSVGWVKFLDQCNKNQLWASVWTCNNTATRFLCPFCILPTRLQTKQLVNVASDGSQRGLCQHSILSDDVFFFLNRLSLIYRISEWRASCGETKRVYKAVDRYSRLP